jgi:hypothetical protein
MVDGVAGGAAAHAKGEKRKRLMNGPMYFKNLNRNQLSSHLFNPTTRFQTREKSPKIHGDGLRCNEQLLLLS